MRLIDADKVIIPSEEYCARMAIQNAPTVDAVEVVHGHWEIDKETGENICSECGKDTCGYLDMEDEFFDENGVKGWRLTQPNYCKHCGAKMDEDIKSTENGKNC